MLRDWVWTLLAGATGLGASFAFSGVLRLQPFRFVLAWAVLAGIFLAIYARLERISFRTQIERRWRSGLVVGLLLGALLIRQVLAQEAGPRPEGLSLAGTLVWFGLLYGVVDAMMLSVVPVLSLYGARTARALGTGGSRLRWALVALAGSALAAALYHLGFAEFQGGRLLYPVIGNLVITLGYLLSGSPLAAILAHVMMHGAAVLHGMATTMQLPPHY
jgi:hypothetical protein